MEIKTSELTLKTLRMIKNINQKDIAKTLEISDSAYNKKEKGIRKFDIDEFAKLSKIFNLSMEEMYIILKNK